ncbi:MAG TPA: phosphoglycolate phosphatase [Desulfuromonadaceae bacterium]
MTVGTVLFDLDGTLVDSLEDLTAAVNHMLAAFGKRPLESFEVRRLVGRGARNLVQRALDTRSPDHVERGLELFVGFNRAHIADKSRLYPGVRELLDTLAAHGIPMAIISNKQEALSRLILETLGVGVYFATVCGGDTFPEMKPSPLPLLRLMERFGTPAADTVMVGDSINDIQAGRGAGITTIGCTWGYGGLDELREADHIAASCGEVAHILLKRGVT